MAATGRGSGPLELNCSVSVEELSSPPKIASSSSEPDQNSEVASRDIRYSVELANAPAPVSLDSFW